MRYVRDVRGGLVASFPLREAGTAALHDDSYSEGRAHLKDLLDAAERGRLATVGPESATAAVVDVDRLRQLFSPVIPSRAEAVPEADGWSIFLPGLPAGEGGATFRGTFCVTSSRSTSRRSGHAFATVSCRTGLHRLRPLRRLPADVVALLISRVGLKEQDVAAMTKDEAIARLHRYWTEGR